ncbi:membrane bound O-acyl transferase family-domain-containing protein [Stachybotrys elegans]|uniref:Membrane bound O-acyl transferase family-domain-containing protein n=1 Tax=Stachybotrys elegans TaxID=80388 RepID=A0A8K0SXN6_9HYPO|nr:membrane bound O-acyl transferase family-domain-containing protein [Stachybotrys elegans]
MESIWKSSGLFGLQLSVMAAILGFTGPSSFLRPAALAIVVLCPYLQLPELEGIKHPVLRAFIGAACVYTVVLYTDAALIHKWSFDVHGPTSSAGGLKPERSKVTKLSKNASKEPRSLPNVIRRFGFGFEVSLQSRFPTTKWPVKTIPPFSRTNPEFVPERAVFILTELARVIFCLLFLVFLDLLPKNADENLVIFSSQRIPFFRRGNSLTLNEIIVRSASVLVYWTSQYIIIQAVYSTLAAITVALGMTPVQSWPPVFGFISDSYSIRQFWGSFYHQLLRRGCGGIAHFLTCTCLGLSKRGIWSRYIYTCAVFMVSGLFHAFSDVAQGIPWSESGALQFFMLQVFGIMLEDAFGALLRLRTSSDWDPAQRSFSTSRRPFKALGYLWTLAWLVWSTPVWIYPSLQRSTGVAIIPISGYFQWALITGSQTLAGPSELALLCS